MVATAVVHSAACKQVGEPVERPAHYYQQNVGGTANLLLAMDAAGVGKLVFSSAAAVYGQPGAERNRDDADLAPIRPYGHIKLACEWTVRNAARACGWAAVNLRSPSVAGAGWDDLTIWVTVWR